MAGRRALAAAAAEQTDRAAIALQHQVRAQNRFTNDLPAALMFTARYSCKWRALGREPPDPQRDKAVSRGP